MFDFTCQGPKREDQRENIQRAGALDREPPSVLLDGLARRLAVSAESLRALGASYCPETGRIGIAERDGQGRKIGRSLLNFDGSVTGDGRRGLYVPAGFSNRAGIVTVVEGIRDTAFLWGNGQAVIGRPATSGMGELLVAYLRPLARPIILVGAFDLRPDGTWPGRDRMRRIGDRMSEAFGARPDSLLPRRIEDLLPWLQVFQRDFSTSN